MSLSFRQFALPNSLIVVIKAETYATICYIGIQISLHTSYFIFVPLLFKSFRGCRDIGEYKKIYTIVSISSKHT